MMRPGAIFCEMSEIGITSVRKPPTIMFEKVHVVGIFQNIESKRKPSGKKKLIHVIDTRMAAVCARRGPGRLQPVRVDVGRDAPHLQPCGAS